MKKSIFAGVAVLTVFTLFSFTSVKGNVSENETKFSETKMVKEAIFQHSEATFPDKFTKRRDIWTLTDNTSNQTNVLNKY